MSTHVWRPLIAAALLFGASCSSGEEATSTTAPTTTEPAPSTTAATTTTAAPTTVATTTTLAPVIRQPLTGEVIEAESDIIDRPALAVKIDNAPGARSNHSGLGTADIVFEEIVEGSITRFAAVFHSEGSPTVGPVRSGRSQDVDLLTSLRQPLFGWSGGNPGVTDLINGSELINIGHPNYGGSYYRGAGSAPHNLYSDTDTLWALTPDDHPGPPPQQFSYLRPEESFNGKRVERADLKMRGIDVVWEWDDAESKWRRSQQGAPHVDQISGPIMATNVVVLVVEYRPSAIDARSPEAQTVGEGPAYVMVDGQLVEGRYVRESSADPYRLVTTDGEPIGLLPGTTWVELAEAQTGESPDQPVADIEFTSGS